MLRSPRVVGAAVAAVLLGGLLTAVLLTLVSVDDDTTPTAEVIAKQLAVLQESHGAGAVRSTAC